MTLLPQLNYAYRVLFITKDVNRGVCKDWGATYLVPIKFLGLKIELVVCRYMVVRHQAPGIMVIVPVGKSQ